jgi:hypothetical protein
MCAILAITNLLDGQIEQHDAVAKVFVIVDQEFLSWIPAAVLFASESRARMADAELVQYRATADFCATSRTACPRCSG